MGSQAAASLGCVPSAAGSLEQMEARLRTELEQVGAKLRAEQEAALARLETQLRAEQEATVAMVQSIMGAQAETLKETVCLEVKECTLVCEEGLQDVQKGLETESEARQDFTNDMNLCMRALEAELTRHAEQLGNESGHKHVHFKGPEQDAGTKYSFEELVRQINECFECLKAVEAITRNTQEEVQMEKEARHSFTCEIKDYIQHKEALHDQASQIQVEKVEGQVLAIEIKTGLITQQICDLRDSVTEVFKILGDDLSGPARRIVQKAMEERLPANAPALSSTTAEEHDQTDEALWKTACLEVIAGDQTLATPREHSTLVEKAKPIWTRMREERDRLRAGRVAQRQAPSPQGASGEVALQNEGDAGEALAKGYRALQSFEAELKRYGAAGPGTRPADNEQSIAGLAQQIELERQARLQLEDLLKEARADLKAVVLELLGKIQALEDPTARQGQAAEQVDPKSSSTSTVIGAYLGSWIS